MTLDYTTPGEVKFYIKEYIDKMSEEFPYMEKVNNTKSVKAHSSKIFVHGNYRCNKSG